VALSTFTTDRLILRPRTLGDYDACLAMDRDPEVVRYIPGPWADAGPGWTTFRACAMMQNWTAGSPALIKFPSRKLSPRPGFLGRGVFLVCRA
jgi:RimJ/RimL family protein N-acetyltransferase